MKRRKRECNANTCIALVDIVNTWLQYIGIVILCIMTNYGFCCCIIKVLYRYLIKLG